VCSSKPGNVKQVSILVTLLFPNRNYSANAIYVPLFFFHRRLYSVTDYSITNFPSSCFRHAVVTDSGKLKVHDCCRHQYYKFDFIFQQHPCSNFQMEHTGGERGAARLFLFHFCAHE